LVRKGDLINRRKEIFLIMKMKKIKKIRRKMKTVKLIMEKE